MIRRRLRRCRSSEDSDGVGVGDGCCDGADGGGYTAYIGQIEAIILLIQVSRNRSATVADASPRKRGRHGSNATC
jgi:hypothetical protein